MIKKILTMRIVPSHLHCRERMIVFVVDDKGTKGQSETTSQEQCAPTNRGAMLLVVGASIAIWKVVAFKDL